MEDVMGNREGSNGEGGVTGKDDRSNREGDREGGGCRECWGGRMSGVTGEEEDVRSAGEGG